MRAHAGRVGGVVFAYAVAVLFGLASAALLLLARGAGPSGTKGVALAVPTLLFLGWLTGPLITLGFDSTVDPAKLAVYPLTARQMTVGLFAVSCAGAGGLFSALTLLGAVGALAPAGPLAAVSLVAGLCVVGICVAAARAIAAVISGASRRVRDTLMFLATALIMSVGIIPQLLGLSDSDDPGVASFAHLARPAELVSTLLPTGPSAQSMLAAADGRVLPALLWLLGGLAWLALMLWIWSLALRRMLSRPLSAPAKGARVRRVAASLSLYPRAFRWLPRNRAGAVAAKELRLMVRDPRQRAAVLGAIVGSVPVAFTGLGGSGDGAVLRVAGLAFFLGATATNLYGFDGRSHWMNVAAADDARSDLIGKCTARASLAAPLTLVVVVVLARVGDAWHLAVPALALSVAAFGLALGPAAWVSVAYPWPMPAEQKNIFAGANTGQGFRAFFPVMGIMVVGTLALLALGLPMAAAGTSVALLVLLSVAAAVVGVAAFSLGLWRAVARSNGRQPELLLALTKD